MFVCAVFHSLLFSLLFFLLFFLTCCGKTGMCHYLLLAAEVEREKQESPITMNPSACL